MMQRITDTMVEIEGEELRPYTTVKIIEVEEGEWSIGGKTLSVEDINQMRSKSSQG